MEPALKSKGFGSAFGVVDVGDHIANRLELFSFLVRDFNIELFFEGHHKLDGVEGVGAEIFDELGFRVDLVGIDAELVDDDVLYAIFDAFV